MGVTYTSGNASAYISIATYTVTGSAVASYTFSNIPTSYTDLVLIGSPNNGPGTYPFVQVGNGTVDTTSSYSSTQIYGSGTTVGSTRLPSTTYGWGGTANAYSNIKIYFMNYANTNTFKTWLCRGGSASDYVSAEVTLWRSASAINTIKIYPDTGTYPVGTTFNLYGIKAAG